MSRQLTPPGNCHPRHKARLLEVTNETSRNKGRFFWKCFVCQFFLWREDARTRETGLGATAAGVAHEEPVPRPKTPSYTQRPLTSYGIQVSRRPSDPETTDSDVDDDADGAPAAGMHTPCPPPSTKRKRDAWEDESGGFDDMSSDEERQLAALTDASARKAAAEKTLPTPAAEHTKDAIGSTTPGVARTLFPGAESSKRQKTVSFNESPASEVTFAPITPLAKRPEATDAPSSSPDATAADVSEEVTRLLRAQNIDGSAIKDVQKLLATAALRTRGITMGRDSARTALKKKDVQIARLQERVAALENKEKMHHSQVTNIKASLMRMYDDN